MKYVRFIISIILISTMILSLIGVLGACSDPDENNNPADETPPKEGSMTPTVTETNTSFFEDVFF